MIKLLEIDYDDEGIFINRPNRYVGEIEINGNIELVHIHDPGRLKELLYKGNKVLVKKASNINRKTKYDMIAAFADENPILINSAFHRKIAEAIIENESINPLGKIESYKAEVKYNKSRIDFLLKKNDKNIWLEIKGCTLSDDKTAVFPDAPTERGRRHLMELMEIKSKGEEAAVYILIFRNADCFEPNIITDIEFYKTFYEAIRKGVKIYPILCKYENKSIYYKKILKISSENTKI